MAGMSPERWEPLAKAQVHHQVHLKDTINKGKITVTESQQHQREACLMALNLSCVPKP